VKVELYEAGGKNARVVDATRVLVRNAQGTPVALVAEWGAAVLAAHADDPDFQQLLTTFGADRVVVRNRVEFVDGKAVTGE
jgi:CTP:molybdopterin cytidylyltransferase MocA